MKLRYSFKIIDNKKTVVVDRQSWTHHMAVENSRKRSLVIQNLILLFTVVTLVITVFIMARQFFLNYGK